MTLIHTYASLSRLIGSCGVNYNRFCTQNAKVQAFWRIISTTLECVKSNIIFAAISPSYLKYIQENTLFFD